MCYIVVDLPRFDWVGGAHRQGSPGLARLDGRDWIGRLRAETLRRSQFDWLQFENITIFEF